MKVDCNMTQFASRWIKRKKCSIDKNKIYKL